MLERLSNGYSSLEAHSGQAMRKGRKAAAWQYYKWLAVTITELFYSAYCIVADTIHWA